MLFCLAFVAGVWGLQQLPVLPSLWWALLLLPLFLLPFFLVRYLPLPRYLVVGVSILMGLMSGFFWASAIAQHRLSQHLDPTWENEVITMEGVVATMPQHMDRGERFEFDVEQVIQPALPDWRAHFPPHITLSDYKGAFKPFTNSNNDDDKTRLQPRAPTKFHAGERWQLRVKLKRPHGLANPYGFDAEAWALERNIRATGYVRNHPQNQRVTPFVWRPAYVVQTLREGIRTRMEHVLSGKPYTPVLLALAIGDDSNISPEDWQLFLATGTNHLMSISGLHITMLAGFALAGVYALWRRVPALVLRIPARKVAVLAGMLTALMYALVAGFSVPTQRTLYMLSVIGIALWANRPIRFGRVLVYTVFVVVLLDPWAVLAPGFWLSFGAVAIMSFAMGGRLRRPHWFREALHTQWAVTIGLFPMLLIMFQQLSIISPVANAVAIPLVSLVVVPLTLFGAILPVDIALVGGHAAMQLCMQFLEFVADSPWSVWQQHAPPLWTLPLAMLGVLWTLLPKGVPMRPLGWMLCLPMVFVLPIRPIMGAMKVAVLDVGQGLSVVVQTHQHTLLYDTGPKYSPQSDSGTKVIMPYLRGEGVTALNGMVVSHNDTDHSGGMASVLANVPVSWLLSSLPEAAPELADQRHLHCTQGQHWVWDQVSFDVLGPTLASYADDGIKDNNRSCVLKITSQYGSLLLTGDIEKPAEAALLDAQTDEASPISLQADVMTAPHHGSKTSSTQAFIRAVQPKATVFTMGYLNRFHHPKDEVVQRYVSERSAIFRSDEHGAVTFYFAPMPASPSSALLPNSTIRVEPWRFEHARYWQMGARNVSSAQAVPSVGTE